MFHVETGESVKEEGLRTGKDEVHIEGDVGWDLGFEGGPGVSGRRSTLTLVIPLAARAANHTRPYLPMRLDLSRASFHSRKIQRWTKTVAIRSRRA